MVGGACERGSIAAEGQRVAGKTGGEQMDSTRECDRSLRQRWRAMSRDERRALVPGAWRLAVVRGLMARGGFGRTQRWLARWAPAGGAGLTEPARWHARAASLARLARRMPDTRCLARSLTLWWWMRASGFDPQLRMGVRPGASGIEGHAWVECDGLLFDETPDGASRYSRLEWGRPE